MEEDLETAALEMAAAVREWRRVAGLWTSVGHRPAVAMAAWHAVHAARAKLLLALAADVLEEWPALALDLLRTGDQAIGPNVDPPRSDEPWPLSGGPTEDALLRELVTLAGRGAQRFHDEPWARISASDVAADDFLALVRDAMRRRGLLLPE